MESARVSMKSCDVCIHTSAQCGCSMKPDLLGPAAIAPTKPMSVFGLVIMLRMYVHLILSQETGEILIPVICSNRNLAILLLVREKTVI